MTWAVVLGAAAMVALAVFAPGLGRRLPPATATRLMAAGAIAIAAVTLWVLAVLASTAIAQVPVVAAFGDWSTTILRATDPVPMWVGVLCGLLWLGVAALALRRLLHRIVALIRMRRFGRSVNPAGSVVIVDSDRPEAFSTVVGRGRVYVTTGMLRALRPDERRALIAHESSHVAHRHAWWLIASDLAAVVNPALVPTARAIAHTVERWADEDAARAIGDRGAVARAVARAALHVHSSRTNGSSRTGTGVPAGNSVSGLDLPPSPVGVTQAVGGRVPDRVAALLLAPPRPRVLPVLVVAALLAASIGSGFAIQNHTDDYFDHASACPGPTCGQRPHLRMHVHVPRSRPAGPAPIAGRRTQTRYNPTTLSAARR